MVTQTENVPDESPSRGWIDIHSHLLPGIDDGCIDLQDSIRCVRRLMQLGFVGSVCTPHMDPHQFPLNTPSHVEAWTAQIALELEDAGLTYNVWPGGELGISDVAIDWMKQYGVPCLARSRCVLTDFWFDKWPRCVVATYEWLLGEGYQPILAHPERLPPSQRLRDQIKQLVDIGVWLQGNFRSFTGEDGLAASEMTRDFVRDGTYRFLSLDMHGSDSLEPRIEGLQLVVDEFGLDAANQRTGQFPFRDIIGRQ